MNQEPDEVQVRVRGGRSQWQWPVATVNEPTPRLRAEYLVRNWPKVYEMRLLYVHPPCCECALSQGARHE